ncbi:succinate--CoA ligase [ADP-forming] subunit beta, mitochondrial [Carica papaya]|uniref:succinate--CoA ligase [ADP-forming] subunit beta, mitochondrial n=1 Tax=Carica papaya TaxID=3649 RepID=UPI000B8D049B|nr:succinate--CoA ligase [ADP-forming] subunit beta, mitochondrial [Carica papaya]
MAKLFVNSCALVFLLLLSTSVKSGVSQEPGRCMKSFDCPGCDKAACRQQCRSNCTAPTYKHGFGSCKTDPSTQQQGAELMGKHGINVPRGVAVSSVDEIKKVIQDVFPKENELVVKSQILAGGRGLGTFKSGLKGGVHIVKADQVEDIASKMLGQILVTKQTGPQGKVVSKVYLCEKLSLVNEMYFAITLDRKTAGPIIIACRKGGTSIEDLAEKFPDMIVKVPIDVFKGITDEDAAKVVDGLAPKVADRKESIEQVKKLYKLFCDCDCTLLEVSLIPQMLMLKY